MFISNFFLRIVLVLTVSVVASFTYSQNDGTIAGRTWDVCTTPITMIDDDCYYFVTYSFNADGTYTDSRQYTTGNITANYRGTWELKNNRLTFTVTHENGISSPPRTEKIIWINSTTFYTIGKEGFFGPKVYTFYTAKF